MLKRVITGVLAMSVVLGLSGCAIAPTENHLVTNNRVYFLGFAIEPSAGVRIQAKVPWTEDQWITLATGQADPDAYVVPGIPFSRPLYDWRLDAAVPSWAWSNNRAQVRAQTNFGGSWVPMWMYDSAGNQCIGARMAEADNNNTVLNVDLAGMECSRASNGGEDRYHITVRRQ